MTDRQIALVLPGGIALGSYQAGAYAALHPNISLRPAHLAGTSIGAVNAALIAGGAPDGAVDRLSKFWESLAIEPTPFGPAALGLLGEGPVRHGYNWLSVFQTRLFGRPGIFEPRLAELMMASPSSLYDLTPLRTRLERFVDFGRLNSGAVRVSVLATDLETGEAVIFDTEAGDEIGPDHLLASCGFLPDFNPVEIDGRLLGDGAFVANAPVEAVLDGSSERDLLCFVVDLFSAEGARPHSLETAATRRWELVFGNQTRDKLKRVEREFRLRQALANLRQKLGDAPFEDRDLAAMQGEPVPQSVTFLHLSYLPPRHEAGPEKPFDFSRATLAERWQAGERDMKEAIRIDADAPRAESVSIHTVRIEN